MLFFDGDFPLGVKSRNLVASKRVQLWQQRTLLDATARHTVEAAPSVSQSSRRGGHAVEGFDDYVVERSPCATVFVQPHLVSIFRRFHSAE
jgi:hypothetical protein